MGFQGSGKAQPLDADILTPDGWIKMGDIQVGDTITAADGTASNVTGVYPKGELEIFRITFSDGTFTECCDEHLWVTQTPLKRRWEVRPLHEIRDTLDERHKIPIIKPVQFTETERPLLDPYLMGVLLGDGCFTLRSVGLSNPETDIVETVKRLLPDGIILRPSKSKSYDYRLVKDVGNDGGGSENVLLTALRTYGLMGHKSTAKFIPTPYLFAPIETRLAVLQGLLDTDGSTYGRTLEYSTSSPQLAADVQFLVRSFGGKVTVSQRVPSYTYNGEKRRGAVSYRMHISLPTDVVPFRSVRKSALYIPRSEYQPYRFIESIESIGNKEAQCISVSAPDELYVTNDFIVTHNTFTATHLAAGLAKLSNNPNPRVAFFDTEKGSDFFVTYFQEQNVQFDVAKSRSFVELMQFMKEVTDPNNPYDVAIVDSVSHVWNELKDSYEKRKRRSNGLLFQDWGPIKNEWRQFTDSFINSKLHVIALGRAGYEYDTDPDESGRMQLTKTGTKMKAEGEFGYESDILLEMERVRNEDKKGWSNRCYVVKDRTNMMNGKTIDNPKFEDFKPILAKLNIGGEHYGVDVSTNSQDMFDDPDKSYVEKKRQQTIAIEELNNLLVELGLDGTSTVAKQGRIELLKDVFSNASKTFIESLDPEVIRQGIENMRIKMAEKAIAA